MTRSTWTKFGIVAGLLFLLSAIVAVALINQGFRDLGDAVQVMAETADHHFRRLSGVDSTLKGTPVLLGTDTVALLTIDLLVMPDTVSPRNTAAQSQALEALAAFARQDTFPIGTVAPGTRLRTGVRPRAGLTGLLAILADSMGGHVLLTTPRRPLHTAIPEKGLIATLSRRPPMVRLVPIAVDSPADGQLWLSTPVQFVPLYLPHE